MSPLEKLYRSVPESPDCWKESENRVSSAAFKQSSGCSVDRDGQRTEQAILTGFEDRFPGQALVKVTCQQVLDVQAHAEPEPLQDNIFHAGLYRDTSEQKLVLSSKQATKLARKAETVRKRGQSIHELVDKETSATPHTAA